MDSLGERLIKDRARVEALIKEARAHERKAREKWAEAHEIERLRLSCVALAHSGGDDVCLAD